jgi:hypothetical protein
LQAKSLCPCTAKYCTLEPAPLLQLLSAQMATPLLPLGMYSSSAESSLWSSPLLYLAVFAVHFGVVPLITTDHFLTKASLDLSKNEGKHTELCSDKRLQPISRLVDRSHPQKTYCCGFQYLDVSVCITTLLCSLFA